MLARINALLLVGNSFAFETTLSSKSFARLIPRAREAGAVAQAKQQRVSRSGDIFVAVVI